MPAHYYNPETGSYNISKASLEWKQIWWQAKQNETDDKHPLHAAYEEVNRRVVEEGEHWTKCANCGSPYRLTPEWSSETICSEKCADEYRAYLSNPF